MSVRLQNISSHLKRDAQDINTSITTPMNTINEDECIGLENSEENLNNQGVCHLEIEISQ